LSGAGNGVGPGGLPPEPRTVLELSTAARGWREALLSLKGALGAVAGQDASVSGTPATAGTPAADPHSPDAAPTLAALVRAASATETGLDARPPENNLPQAGPPDAGSARLPVSAGLPLALTAALSSAGYSPVASAPRGPDAAPGNPLLGWARGSEGAPPSAAVLAAAQALPGPAAALLARGVDPGVALTLQQGWEAAVLGGREPISGSALPPLWQAWGLPNAAPLAALMHKLGGGSAPELPQASAGRPSEQLRQLLGTTPALPPAALVQAFRAGGAPASLLLLGFGRGAATADAFAGQGLSGLAPARGGIMPPASGLVAVQIPAGAPLLLVRHGADGLPAAQQGVKLGGASVQAGVSAGLPWVQPTGRPAARSRSKARPSASASRPAASFRGGRAALGTPCRHFKLGAHAPGSEATT